MAKSSTSSYGYAVRRDPAREHFLGPVAGNRRHSRSLPLRALTLREAAGSGTVPDSHVSDHDPSSGSSAFQHSRA